MERYAEYKDSGIDWIGEIPAGWRVGRISSLYEQRNEKVSDKDYQPLSVTMQGIVPQLETAAKTQDGDNRKLVKSGDFAINSRSDRRGSCGISSLDGSVSLITNVLKPLKRDAMDERFFGFLYKSEGFSDEYYKWGTGIVDDLWSTNWSRMKNISVPIPPENDQRDIANYLDSKTAEIDGLVVDQQKSIELLKEYRKVVISEAVTKGLDSNAPMKDSGIDWIGEIPIHWNFEPLKHSIDTLPGYAFKGEEFEQEGSIRLLRGVNLGVGKIRWDDTVFAKSHVVENLDIYALKQGDMILGLDRPWIKDGLRLAFLSKDDEPCYLVQRVAKITAKQERCALGFLYYLLETDIMFCSLQSETTGISVPHISTTQVENIQAPIPPLLEQESIVGYLDTKVPEIKSLINSKYLLIDKLQEYRKSLISEAVTGKFKVPGVA